MGFLQSPPCEMVTMTAVVAGTCELARYFGHHSMVFGTWLSVYGGVRVQLTYEDHSAKLSSMGASGHHAPAVIPHDAVASPAFRR